MKKILPLGIVLIISMLIVLPLLHNGFIVTDDGEWMIIRFSAFYESFRDGQFPVRWLGRLNNGFGYPVSNFMYPGFMYLGVPIHILGFGYIHTIKIIMAFSMVMSGAFTYLWLKKMFPPYEAVFGAIIYMLLPYHIYDLFTRGSVGELLALGVVPVILWSITRNDMVMTSLSVAFLILSHNTLALFFIPVIFLYSIIQYSFTKKGVLWSIIGVATGLGISMFFWLPAILELPYTRFSTTQISDWKNYFASLELIGYSSVLILVVALCMLFSKYRLELKHKKIFPITFFILLTLISVALSSQYSDPIWGFLPSSLIQFPFRLLSLAILGSAFLSAWIVSEYKQPVKYVFPVIVFILIGFEVIPQFKNIRFTDKNDDYYATNLSTTTTKDEYMPHWVNQTPSEWPHQKVESSEGEITDILPESHRVTFNIKSNENTTAVVNTVYFPGWKATVGGREVTVKPSGEQGLIGFPVPKGEHTVSVSFERTPVRIIAETVSILSLITVLVINFFPAFRKYEVTKE